MPSETLPDTPVMRQYQDLKRSHPQALLFFRLGDFYELFADDARLAAPLLGLVLTSRQGIPMCGVPYHSSQNYIGKLLRAGHKIAIAEQTEEASKTKKLVRREVIRVITPGTIVEDELLDPTMTNFLVSIELDIVGWGAACLDASTGEFWATQALNDREHRKLFDLLARVRPAEVVVSPAAAEALKLREALSARACLTRDEEVPSLEPRPAWSQSASWANHNLALKAALRCRRYVGAARVHVKEPPAPVYREAASEMSLDETAIRTLELVEAASGDRRHSLWGLLDCCRTPMGSRKLKAWLLHPSIDLSEITLRQNCVEDLVSKPEVRQSLGELLRDFSDLPRAVSRLSTRQAAPRDLAALRDSLNVLPRLAQFLTDAPFCEGLAVLAGHVRDAAAGLSRCAGALNAALSERPPLRLSDGGLIKQGYNKDLDQLRMLKTDARSVLEELEERERKATGIASLKAGYNSVFGYYIEVTKTHSAKVPARFTRKQTLTNAERYITPELKELETRILGAEDKILRLEARLFEDLREAVLREHDALLRLAALVAELDVYYALGQSAAAYDFVKPEVDLSYDLEIVDGRHPVLAALLPAGQFVPNSTKLNASEPQIMVLTGPNMSGKSTYLRQNALIALMAQAGSFVPAKSAKLGVVDKILTRIGAQDALAQGQSTFMVEMKETSHILRSATPRSLLILDEVGRGTSTFDGISIAWAVLEHLHGAYMQGEEARGPRVLFATHYFELTEIARRLKGVVNCNVEAKEWTTSDGRTEVVFLHKISEGPADRSYGIHVAALAGLPAGVLARAKEILSNLENESASGRISGAATEPTDTPELPLFSDHPALEALRLLNVDTMTPLDAIAALSALKKKL